MGLPLENMPEWPATMSRPWALAYSGVAEVTLRGFEARGIVRFLPVGPHGQRVAPKEQLDTMLRQLWNTQGRLPPSEDMAFDGDD